MENKKVPQMAIESEDKCAIRFYFDNGESIGFRKHEDGKAWLKAATEAIGELLPPSSSNAR